MGESGTTLALLGQINQGFGKAANTWANSSSSRRLQGVWIRLESRLH